MLFAVRITDLSAAAALVTAITGGSLALLTIIKQRRVEREKKSGSAVQGYTALVEDLQEELNRTQSTLQEVRKHRDDAWARIETQDQKLAECYQTRTQLTLDIETMKRQLAELQKGAN